jgi:hypothetical protein
LKRQQLDFEADVDFLLIGIVTNQTISRLGWLINQKTGLDFSRIEDLELPDFNPAANSGFSKLDYFDEENLIFATHRRRSRSKCSARFY